MIIEILNESKKNINNRQKTFLVCPTAIIQDKIDFGYCCQTLDKKLRENEQSAILIECGRRPELGFFETNITFQHCREWIDLKKILQNLGLTNKRDIYGYRFKTI